MDFLWLFSTTVAEKVTLAIQRYAPLNSTSCTYTVACMPICFLILYTLKTIACVTRTWYAVMHVTTAANYHNLDIGLEGSDSTPLRVSLTNTAL